MGYNRTCDCPKTHINCLPTKEWLKCQLGVWQFTYEGKDIRWSDQEIEYHHLLFLMPMLGPI